MNAHTRDGSWHSSWLMAHNLHVSIWSCLTHEEVRIYLEEIKDLMYDPQGSSPLSVCSGIGATMARWLRDICSLHVHT